MSIVSTDKEYINAQEELKKALRFISTQVDITSPVFKALFKGQVLRLYEKILDDPKTYQIEQKEKINAKE